MKKLILSLVMIASFTVANAQGSDWFKIGIHAGLPVGDVSDTSSFVLGLDLKYQFLNTDSFAVGLATGYSNYFGKEINGFEIEDFGIVPFFLLKNQQKAEVFIIGQKLVIIMMNGMFMVFTKGFLQKSL